MVNFLLSLVVDSCVLTVLRRGLLFDVPIHHDDPTKVAIITINEPWWILNAEAELWRLKENSGPEEYELVSWHPKKGGAWLVVSNIFYFHPYLGKSSNLTNIFQMG